ncbi:cytidylate kinase family protein [Patescibacteria group bacterium]|nr:cytidylate kinase family protein [Patescibacteria group bacterium]MBU1907677.1 cytidylate kinase family protein [Patescibacteria group bacterium]
MIITISGVPGSGKTTVAKILAERLGMKFYSMGDLRGKMATERGLTIDELNKLGETEAFTDNDVDTYQTKLGQTEDNFVIEGRLSWHFIPHSFKIFLECDEKEAARRIFLSKGHSSADRKDEPLYATIEEAAEVIRQRITSDNLRYNKYYGVRYQDKKNYDLIIDTTNLKGAKATAETILEKMEELAVLKK